MSDAEDNSEEKQFVVDRAKQGRAACKKCKEKCPVGEIRIAKVTASPCSGKMKNWYHLDCILEQFLKQRITTIRIKSIEDIDGITDLNDEDIKTITKRINESEQLISEKYGSKISPNKPTKSPNKSSTKKESEKRRNSNSSSTSLKLEVSSVTDITSPIDVKDTPDEALKTESPKKKSPKTLDGTKRKRNKSFSKESISQISKKHDVEDVINIVKEPLPNLFVDVRLLVEDGGEKLFDKWIRYFIAYGGTLVDSNAWEEATHVLHLEDSVADQTIKSPRTARHVILEWIKRTVTNGSLEDFRAYSVRWEPEKNLSIINTTKV